MLSQYLVIVAMTDKTKNVAIHVDRVSNRFALNELCSACAVRAIIYIMLHLPKTGYCYIKNITYKSVYDMASPLGVKEVSGNYSLIYNVLCTPTPILWWCKKKVRIVYIMDGHPMERLGSEETKHVIAVK